MTLGLLLSTSGCIGILPCATLISSSEAVGWPTRPCAEPDSQASESCPDPES